MREASNRVTGEEEVVTAFINDERRWDDAMARFLSEIIDRAFPGGDLPEAISYSSFQIPADDAIIYEVDTDFELGEGMASVSFDFDTGEGGLRPIDAPVPPPSIGNVRVTFADEEGEEHRWDPDTGKWPAEKSAE